MSKPVTHFKRKGARRTVCGRLIKETMHDTTVITKVTCQSCLNSHILRG